MIQINKLTRIKLIHTLIWIFFNVVIFYLAYAVIVGDIDKWVWIGLGLFAIEGLILVLFKMKCPLTIIARKYSDSTKDNFDIYLPNWLARLISLSILFFCVLLLLSWFSG